MKLKQLTLAEHRELITDFFYNIFLLFTNPGNFNIVFFSQRRLHICGVAFSF